MQFQLQNGGPSRWSCVRDPSTAMQRRSWAVLIGEKGFTSFVDKILESNEYMESFATIRPSNVREYYRKKYWEVPIYQKYPRYGIDWRDKLQMRAPAEQGSSPWKRLQKCLRIG